MMLAVFFHKTLNMSDEIENNNIVDVYLWDTLKYYVHNECIIDSMLTEEEYQSIDRYFKAHDQEYKKPPPPSRGPIISGP